MLSILGVGFPRTGTMSLKLALEQLGYGPCYHMIEVFDRPEDIPHWREAVAGDADWDRLFGDYQATCDAPGVYFWRELTVLHPAARCILTVRDADAWYDSFRETVFEVITQTDHVDDDTHRRVQQLARELVLDGLLQGQFEDRAAAIEHYHRHNAAVIEQVDPSRLLVFRVEEGWEPLCRFLGVDVPSTLFPHINTRHEFRERFLAESARHEPVRHGPV